MATSSALLPDVLIGVATTAVEREAVFRLRYQVYVEELGIYRSGADHTRNELRDSYDDTARLLYAVVADQVVGTVRVSLGCDAPLPEAFQRVYDTARFNDFVPLERMSVLTRFMVTREQRGSMVPLALLLKTLELHISEGIELSFCDCEPHLVSLYSSLGMRTYAPPYNSPDRDLLVPMVGVVTDRPYLERVGSPLLSFVDVPTGPEGFLTAVADRIAAGSTVQSIESITDVAEWVDLYATLTGHHQGGTSLLDGLSEAEIKTVLAHGHVLECGRGECLVHTGQTARTVYLVLEGTVEVRDGGRVIAAMRERDVFGEVAFLLAGRRISDVYATSERVRVLTLSDRTLRDLIRSESQTAAKLLLNLARGLAGKLVERHALLSADGEE